MKTSVVGTELTNKPTIKPQDIIRGLISRYLRATRINAWVQVRIAFTKCSEAFIANCELRTDW